MIYCQYTQVFIQFKLQTNKKRGGNCQTYAIGLNFVAGQPTNTRRNYATDMFIYDQLCTEVEFQQRPAKLNVCVCFCLVPALNKPTKPNQVAIYSLLYSHKDNDFPIDDELCITNSKLIYYMMTNSNCSQLWRLLPCGQNLLFDNSVCLLLFSHLIRLLVQCLSLFIYLSPWLWEANELVVGQLVASIERG